MKLSSKEVDFLSQFATLLKIYDISNVFYNEDEHAMTILGDNIELNMIGFEEFDGFDLKDGESYETLRRHHEDIRI